MSKSTNKRKSVRKGLATLTAAASLLSGATNMQAASAEVMSKEKVAVDYNQLALQRVKDMVTPVGLTILRLCGSHPENCHTYNGRSGFSVNYTSSQDGNQQPGISVGYSFDKKGKFSSFSISSAVYNPSTSEAKKLFTSDLNGIHYTNSLSFDASYANPQGYATATVGNRGFDTEGREVGYGYEWTQKAYEKNPIGLVMAGVAAANMLYDLK